jgi:HAD superfamily hydrolase (TIGR01549 family)
MRTILFDAGNTLVWLDRPFFVGLLGEFDYEVTEDEFLGAEYTAKLLLDELVRSGNGGTDESRGRRYFAKIFEVLGVSGQHLPELAVRLRERHRALNLWSRVQPGTAEALQRLLDAGHRLGVISNADGRVEALLESVGLARYFEFIIDSHVVGIEKPDPRIFHMGCERMGCPPSAALYVGDIYEIDVVGARGAGMSAVLVDPLDRWAELDCERIRGVHELPERLAALRASAA